jgi:hypothetical protein
MAEWLRIGLQNRVRRFNSGCDLIFNYYAAVVKLVSTRDLKSLGRKSLRVRVSPAVHINKKLLSKKFFVYASETRMGRGRETEVSRWRKVLKTAGFQRGARLDSLSLVDARRAERRVRCLARGTYKKGHYCSFLIFSSTFGILLKSLINVSLILPLYKAAAG